MRARSLSSTTTFAEAFRRETELFLESQMRGDRPLTELLTADYTFVNERLARFYGMRNVYGAHFRRVRASDPHRAGLLGACEHPHRHVVCDAHVPVVRGKYLLDNILGAPPPPPPPNVPPLEETGAAGEPASIRERMAAHRRNPACATCHVRMDPLGFALENFDGIGRWRTMDGTSPIDASGRPSRRDGVQRARRLPGGVAAAPRGVRPHVHGEAPEVRARAAGPACRHAAVRRPARRGARRLPLSSLILGIVESRPFQMRTARGPEASAQP